MSTSQKIMLIPFFLIEILGIWLSCFKGDMTGMGLLMFVGFMGVFIRESMNNPDVTIPYEFY